MAEREPSRRDRDEAEECGGTDYDDWDEYDRNEGEHYSDKGGHKERGDNQKRQDVFIKI